VGHKNTPLPSLLYPHIILIELNKTFFFLYNFTKIKYLKVCSKKPRQKKHFKNIKNYIKTERQDIVYKFTVQQISRRLLVKYSSQPLFYFLLKQLFWGWGLI